MSPSKPRRVALDTRGLLGVDELFTLSEGSRRDAAVGRWFAQGPDELRSLAEKWFTQMRECGADVREQLHDGCPVASVKEAPFGYVNVFKSHVNVGFFRGALLKDPAGLLEGSGKHMRHVKLKPGREIDEAALSRLIEAAYAQIRQRLGQPPASKSRP
jgi:hypothetical protein